MDSGFISVAIFEKKTIKDMTFKEFILNKYSKTYKNLNGKRAATLISIEQILFEYDKFEQLNKPLVMQAEGSDGAKGAAVGNSAAGQSGSDGFCYSYIGLNSTKCKEQCERCKQGGDLRGGSAKGALPY